VTAVEGARTRVVLADDHNLFREAVSDMLQTESSIDIVGQARDGREVLSLLKEEKPDVILLDVDMPNADGRECMPKISQISPHTKVVVLTMFDDPHLMREFFALGASAYLAKTVSRKELVSTVLSVAGGEDRVILSVSREALQKFEEPSQRVVSDRELEILLRVARGMSNTQIASDLYITEGTVKRHLHKIYSKLKVGSRGEATRKALLEGWITARDIA
jgi:DNA-binding NarL/FixJ family response regulator